MSDPHHSIGEVLSLLAVEHPDLTISKIRFLESQGLISPQRTPSGYRKFFDGDIRQLDWVLSQQRDHFLPLKEIKRRMADGLAEADTASGSGEPSGSTAGSPTDAVAGSGSSAGSVQGSASSSRDVSVSEPVSGSGSASDAGSDAVQDAGSDAVLDAGSGAVSDAGKLSGAASPKPSLFATSKTARGESREPDATSSDAAAVSPAAAAVADAGVKRTGALDGREPPTELSRSRVEGSVSLNLNELAAAADVDEAFVGELRRLGLIVTVGVAADAEPVYDHEALMITRTAADFEAHGMPARNLRMFKVAADREAGVYEQVLAALMARGDSARVRSELNDLVGLAESLRLMMLRRLMRPYLD